MRGFRSRLVAAVFAYALPLTLWAPAATAQQWGTIEGQFVLNGPAPELPPLVKEGDSSVRDAAVCSAQSVPDESLVVNPENKGIANIFIYIRKAPSKIHPELKESAEKEVVFDQKNCRFVPHALIVRTDQVVMVKSDDPISHNTHTNPLGSTGQNLIIAPNDRKGVPISFKKPELQYPPVKVTCDIHPHMSAYWLITDHPYVAITDKDGKFRIENLPAGKHTFRVWQERSGYVNTDSFKRDLTVEVKGGETVTLPPFQVQPEIFNK